MHVYACVQQITCVYARLYVYVYADTHTYMQAYGYTKRKAKATAHYLKHAHPHTHISIHTNINPPRRAHYIGPPSKDRLLYFDEIENFWSINTAVRGILERFSFHGCLKVDSTSGRNQYIHIHTTTHTYITRRALRQLPLAIFTIISRTST